MDLNKEIKLSELIRRPKKKTKAPGVTKPSSAKGQAAPQAGNRRPQDRRLPDRRLADRQQRRPAAKLVQLARVPLEPGIVVGGEVRSVAALAAALDSFFTENKLPRRGIRLGIGTNRVGVRTLEVEGIDDERQLANAVRFRAHEALSIPLDQAVLDYHVVSETVDESGGVSRRVLLAAAYQEQIDHYIEACRAAGLELSGIDVEAFALLRAVAPRANSVDGEPTVASVVVSIGHDRSTLAISDGTVCEFMRVLDWGGSKLETAIARELGLTAPRPPSSSSSSISAPRTRNRTIRSSRAPEAPSSASCRRLRGS